MFEIAKSKSIEERYEQNHQAEEIIVKCLPKGTTNMTFAGIDIVSYELPIARQNLADDEPEQDDDFFSLVPDIIFLLQRAGINDEDFENLKRFMVMVVRDLGRISGSKDDSRIGVEIFTDVARSLLDFKTCCSGGKGELEKRIKQLIMHPTNLFVRNPHGDNRILSPYRINVTTAFRHVREEYLNDNKARRKPKLLIFVANMKSAYASFRLLLEAADEVFSVKDTGAWLVVIIVDPLENRQPRLLDDDLTLTRDLLLAEVRDSSHIRRESPSNKLLDDEIKVEVLKKFKKFQTSFLRQVKGDYEKMAKVEMRYNNLASLYAQAFATRQDYGIRLKSYQDLLDSSLLRSIGRLIKNTIQWFGEGVTRSSCPETSDKLERTIWTPRFFSNGFYPDGVKCEWRITTRIGYRINLRFMQLRIENTFDYVVVYDGFEEEPYQALGNYSGEFEQSNLPDVSSTEELMKIVFESDEFGGDHKSGFYAVWNSIERDERLYDTQVLFLIDVSASIENIYEKPIKRYVKQLVKDFYLQEDIDRLSGSFSAGNTLANKQMLKPTKIGLLLFDDRTKLLRNISLPASRKAVFAAVDRLKLSYRDTYIGHALDYSRIAQFLLLEGKSFSISPIAKEAQGRGFGVDSLTPLRRVLFLFTDAKSIDDPKRAVKRLCQNNIVVVVIGVGGVSRKGKLRLRSYCGLYFGINIPSSNVISRLKLQLGLLFESTAISLPTLPPLRPFPNRTTAPKATTVPYVYMYTFPTVAAVSAKRLPLEEIQIVLIAICVFETLLWFGLVCFSACYSNFEIIRDSDSKELLEAIDGGRLQPLPKTKDNFFTEHSVNVKELDDFLRSEEKKMVDVETKR